MTFLLFLNSSAILHCYQCITLLHYSAASFSLNTFWAEDYQGKQNNTIFYTCMLKQTKKKIILFLQDCNHLKLLLRPHAFPICERPLSLITSAGRELAPAIPNAAPNYNIYTRRLYLRPADGWRAGRFNPLHGGGGGEVSN